MLSLNGPTHDNLSAKTMAFHIHGVADTIGGIGYDTCTDVYHMERTVERVVQIISETVRVLSPELTARYPEIEWTKIVVNGNVLRHEYERQQRNCGCQPQGQPNAKSQISDTPAPAARSLDRG